MAHSALHFSAGMALGTVAALPPLVRRAARGEITLSRSFTVWFAASYACGAWAIVPALLRRLGVPEGVCDSAWMNVFFLHPWLNRVKPGGATMGPLVLAAFLGAQYLCLLAALAWVTLRKPRG